MNGAEEEYGASVNFYRFDANEPVNQRLQNSLGLRGHPAVAIIDRDGEVVQRLFGVQPAERLTPLLNAIAEK